MLVYELVIIGGGPAGVAGAIYAARKKIKTVLITDSFGGQSVVSNNIQNWIGMKNISGYDLAKMLEEHLKAQEGIEIFENDLVVEIQFLKEEEMFFLKTKDNKDLKTKTVLITTGSRRKKLNIEGENEYQSKGVFYCTICDAPLMKDKKVAVIGGGNSGLEGVLDLIPYAQKIYLLEINDKLKGDALTQEKIKKEEKVEIILKAQVKEILGENGFVKSLKYLDLEKNELKELTVEGVFVEIGSWPNSELVKDFVKLNEFKEIVVDPKTQATSFKGIWAAGDVTDVLYKQNNIAVGDAIKAVLNIYDYLNK